MSFDKYTDYNKELGIKSVQIGFKKPILETEFNEMQEIQIERLQRLVREYMGDGILNKGTMTYSDGLFTVENEMAVVNGEIIKISSLSFNVSNGSNLYLDTWTEEVTFESSLKAEGNTQESTLSNYILDSRIGVETSRRIITAFNLSTVNNVSGHSYLKLGSISSNSFIQEVPIIGKPLLYHVGSSAPVVNRHNTIWIDTST